MTECPSCGSEAVGHTFGGDRARMAPCGCEVSLAAAEDATADASELVARPEDPVEVVQDGDADE